MGPKSPCSSLSAHLCAHASQDLEGQVSACKPAAPAHPHQALHWTPRAPRGAEEGHGDMATWNKRTPTHCPRFALPLGASRLWPLPCTREHLYLWRTTENCSLPMSGETWKVWV